MKKSSRFLDLAVEACSHGAIATVIFLSQQMDCVGFIVKYLQGEIATMIINPYWIASVLVTNGPLVETNKSQSYSVNDPSIRLYFRLFFFLSH